VVAEEVDDAREVLDVLVLPDAEVGWTDAPFGQDGDGFGEYGARAADGARAEMDQMPIVSKTVFGGILAHGRDGNSITEGNIANLKRVE
jgi:hypothetical protein